MRTKTLIRRLLEKGRVLSKANESRIRDAIATLNDVLKSVAAGLPMNEAQLAQFREASLELLEAELCHDQQRQLLHKALRAANPSGYTWIRDVFDTWLVYEHSPDYDEPEQLYKVSYVVDDAGNVTFGQPVAVIARMVYEPIAVQESGQALTGDCIPLVERAVRRDGTVPI